MESILKYRIYFTDTPDEVGLNFIYFKKHEGGKFLVCVRERLDEAYNIKVRDGLYVAVNAEDVCHRIGYLDGNGFFEKHPSIQDSKTLDDIKFRVDALCKQIINRKHNLR